MLSNKPYLIRAFFEWIVDNACTPFVTVNTLYPKCKVPQQYIDENNQITLNISPEAVRDLKLGNQFLEFRASFDGIVHLISVPMQSILAIYAQENGQGMFFDFEDDEAGDVEGWEGSEASRQNDAVNAKEKKQRPSHLKLVE